MRAHQASQFSATGASMPAPTSSVATPADTLAAKERDKPIQQAINGLPARQRIAVVLRYDEGLCCPTIMSRARSQESPVSPKPLPIRR